MDDKVKRHIIYLIEQELQQREYYVNRERRGLEVGDITAEEFQDYLDDVVFEKKVLLQFHKAVS